MTDLTALRAAVCSTVLTSGAAEYDDARRLHNAAIDRHPSAIVQISRAADIATTLTYAARHGLSVSVRSGGHGVAGHALGGDLVIDLSAYRGIRVDAEARTAVVRAGSTWGDVDTATAAYGLAVPGGRITHTGVAGLTLGGGEGWLSPKHGLSSDNLLSVELVTADGRLVTVSESTEPELFWALRGGGGNFGVVTSFTFRLHPIEPMILGGLMLYRLEDAHHVLGLLGSLHEAGTDELGAAAVFMSAPPAPFVPGDLVGQPVLGVVPAWLGDPDRGRAVLAPLWNKVEPLVDAAAPMPYVALQAQLDASAVPGLRHRWACSFLPAVPDPLVDVLVRAAAAAPSPHSHIIVSPLSGAVTRTPAEATAFPHRSASWLVHSVGCWPDPADDEINLAWTRDLGAAIRGFGETGTYVNLDDELDDARLRWAYGAERYRRLQAIKAEWDPDDVFRHCDHITVPHV